MGGRKFLSPQSTGSYILEKFIQGRVCICVYKCVCELPLTLRSFCPCSCSLQVYVNRKVQQGGDTASSHGNKMAVLTQTSQCTGGTPDIPPLLDFSTLNMSFTGALPRKANTSQLGSIVFQGGMTGSGKGGITV